MKFAASSYSTHTPLLPPRSLPPSEEGVLVIHGSGRPRSVPLLPLHSVELPQRSVPVLPLLHSSPTPTAASSASSPSRRCHRRWSRSSSSHLRLASSLLGRSGGRWPARRQRGRLGRATGSAGQVCVEEKQTRGRGERRRKREPSERRKAEEQQEVEGMR